MIMQTAQTACLDELLFLKYLARLTYFLVNDLLSFLVTKLDSLIYDNKVMRMAEIMTITKHYINMIFLT